MALKSGPDEVMTGSIRKSLAHKTRTSATDVRELVSITMDRTSRIGRAV
jgi:hypothetical protein